MVVRAHNQRKGRDYTKLGMLECGQQSVVITISSVLIYRSLVVMSTLGEGAFIHHKIFLQTSGSQSPIVLSVFIQDSVD